MMGLTVMICAQRDQVILSVGTVFTQGNYVVGFQIDSSVCHRESRVRAVLARAFSSFKSSRTKRGIANERHSRNHATFQRSLRLRLNRELVNKSLR
jgi:hypothetical protein